MERYMSSNQHKEMISKKYSLVLNLAGLDGINTAECKQNVTTRGRKSLSDHPNFTKEEAVLVQKVRNSFSGFESSNAETTAALLGIKVMAADMLSFMQVHAFQSAKKAHGRMDKFSARQLAHDVKKEFDKVYGPTWHCIVGTSFGSFVTHSKGCFVYFAMGKLIVMLFKTTIRLKD